MSSPTAQTEPDDAPAWVKPNRVLLSQLPVVALLTIVAVPIFGAAQAFGFSALILGMALLEGFVCAWAMKQPSWKRSALGVGSTFLTSLLYSIAAAAVIAQNVRAANLFVLVLLSSSMTYVLLRYYQRPVAFVVGVAPQILVVLLVGLALAIPQLRRGEYMLATAPVATSALLILMFWTTRAQLAGAWRSLTERERAAAAANQAKSDFLATMSHEIRTPLNGVLGMAQAMTADDLGQVQRDRLKIIRRSGEDLLAILNDVLDLSKIEAGALELEMSEFDIEHLARGAVATFAYETHKKGVAFHFEIAEDARGIYRGDAARVRQVIYNLTSNAVKFTAEGSVTVALDAHNGGLRFAVSDSGVGIAPEQLSRLFDKFVQADSSATRRFGGAGLGLAITRELAMLMGGTIAAQSRLGEGSTFVADLPEVRRMQPANSNAHEALVASATVPAPEKREAGESLDLRVLAAEDNKVNQLVLKTLLSQAGVEPTIVENGARAVEAWETQAWDIILMDIQMPEMDGVTATKKIRAREAETGRQRTPILAVTANAMVHQIAEYNAAGMDGIVPKPIEISKLFAAMETALDGPHEQAATAAA